MTDPVKAIERAPFAALIGVSSLLAALLYVAGFAFRWAYYYNFGVQHLVFKLSFASFLIAAFELIRLPENLGRVALAVLVPLLVFNAVVVGLRRVASSTSTHPIPAVVRRVWIALDVPLAIDLARAALIVYATYRIAATLGYEAFREHVIESPRNPLPTVTAVLGKGVAAALACGGAADTSEPVAFVGDGRRLHELLQVNRTCSRPGAVTWRLLYRDDQEIYLFASERASAARGPDGGDRPLTLVIPRGDTVLVLQ